MRDPSEETIGAWASQPPLAISCVWVINRKKHLSAIAQLASLLFLGFAAPVIPNLAACEKQLESFKIPMLEPEGFWFH